ncbi:hypothetical protein Golob_014153, partial [Gossypium lobatum]|nr:hypothetical protein [Gossypium lobatum]
APFSSLLAANDVDSVDAGAMLLALKYLYFWNRR